MKLSMEYKEKENKKRANKLNSERLVEVYRKEYSESLEKIQ